MRLPWGLLGLAMLLSSPLQAQPSIPVVIDATNSFQSSISAYRVAKEGFPWGWVPEMTIIVKMDPMESDDVLLLQHLQGKKKWGSEQKCRLRHHWKPVGMGKFECRGAESMAVNKGGNFSVRITYKQGGVGKLHKDIDTLHYSVIKHKCDNRRVKGRWTPSSCYVVDHDFRIGEGWVTELTEDETTPTFILLRTWFKYSDKEPSRPEARCYLNGKKVAEAKRERKQKEITYRAVKKANGRGQRTTWARWYWRFYDLGARPPQKTVSIASYPNVFYLNKNPGDYTCVITADGDKLATLSFKVGADGKIVRPPCQGDGTVRAPENVHLVKVAYGKGANIKYKARDYANKPLYGRKWSRGCPPR